MTVKSSAPELEPLKRALHEMHRLLLMVLKKDRERMLGHGLNPTEWFQALISQPEYQWLKPLNSLLSDLDALSELKVITPQDVGIVQSELGIFFFVENDDVTSFNSHYRKLFANHPEVIFAHGQLRQAYVPLAASSPPFNAEEVRRGWHNIGASKRKLLN